MALFFSISSIPVSRNRLSSHSFSYLTFNLMKCFIIFSMLMAFGVGSVSGVTYTWTGGNNTTWAQTNNWASTGGTYPGTAAGDIVIIPATARAPILAATLTNSLASLTFTGTNTLTINAGFTLTVTGAVVNNSTLASIGTITGTATSTLNCASVSIGNNANMTFAAIILNVSGTTSVGGGTGGSLNLTSTTGSKTFAGIVTINSGATFAENVAEAITFSSDVVNNGTLTENGAAVIGIAGSFTNNGPYTASSGTHTFSGATKTIGGSYAISIPTATFTGNYTNSGILTFSSLLTVTSPALLTNNGTITASTAISGTGGLTQGANATLNIAGTSGINALDAFTNTGNTVNYSGAGQTIHSNNYYHLTLSGSGTDILQTGTTAINGNLNMTGSVTTNTVANIIVGGNLSIGNGTTFLAQGFNLTVTGTTTIGGGASGNLTVAVAAGTKTFNGLLTVNSGGSWINNWTAADVNFGGGITNNGTFTAGTGIYTFITNSNQTLTGTLTIPNVTVNSPTVLTNNGTLTVGAALSGTGGFTQGSTGILNIGGTSVVTLDATTNAGNTVIFSGSGQTINPINYYNLILSGSGTAILQTATTTIAGTLTNTNSTTTAVTTMSIGNVLLSGGVFNAGSYNINVTGNWTNNNGAGLFVPGTGTVNFTGNSSSINGTATSQTFNNLIIAKTTGQTLSYGGNTTSVTLNGDLTLTTGTFAPGATLIVIGNWNNNGGTFTPGTGTVTLVGNGKYIQGNLSTAFYGLTIGNAANILLGIDQTTVNGTLTLSNGLLRLGAYNIILSATSPAIAASSFYATNMIIADGTGQIKKIFTGSGSYSFPIGDSSGNYAPITLNFTSGTFAGGAYVGVNETNTKYPQNTSTNNYLNRFWSVSQSGISAFTCTVTGSYNSGDLVGQANLSIASEYTNSAWSTFSTLSGNTLNASGVTNFGDFTGVGFATITPSASTLTGFDYMHNAGPSVQQSFTVSGINLTSGIIITPPSDYEISLTNGSGFQSTPITVPQSVGFVYTVPVYVRLKTGLPVGSYTSENIVCTSNSAVTQNVVVSGTVTLATYYSIASANWNVNTTWSNTSGGGAVAAGLYPQAGDIAIIENAKTVTVNGNYSCTGLQIGSPGNNTSGVLNFSGSSPSLTVSGIVQLGGFGSNTRTGTVTFTSGSTLNTGSLVLGNSLGTPAAGILTMTAGGTLITGSLTVNTVAGNTWTPGIGTVILTGSLTLPATIFTSFYNLQINAGTTALGVALNSITGGSLTVKAGATLSLGTFGFGGTIQPSVVNLECGGIGSTITGSGILHLGGPVNVTNPSGSGTSATISCPISLDGTRIFTINDDGSNSANLTISGVIGTANGITKAGSGIMLLSGVNTYTGATTINTGTLSAGSTQAFGANSAVTLSNNSSALLNITGFDNTIGSITGGGTTGGNVTLGASNLTIGSNNSSPAAYAGTISGTGTITKSGTGTLIFSGVNTYSGLTTVNTGTLQLGNAAALGSTSGNTTVSSGAVLDLNGQNVGTELLGIQGTGISNTGALINSNATTTSFAGDINGTYSVGGSGAITLTGNVQGTLTKVGSNALTLSGTADNVGLGMIANSGTVILAKTSSSAPNQHAIGGGGLTIGGAIVQLAGSGGDQIYDGCTVTINSGTFDLNAQIESIDGLTGNGGTITNNGGNASILTFGIGNSNNTYSGIITNGTGGLSIVKAGTGTYTLSGLNTYNGTTAVNGGILKAGVSAQSFGVNSAVSLANIAGVGLDITGFSNAIGSLTGGGTTGGNVLLGAASLTIGTDNASPGAYSGIISGTGAIIKNGTGMLILSGMNAYTGTTTISAGTLQLGTSSTVSTSGPLGTSGAGSTTVASGAVLDLNGFSLTAGAAEALTVYGTGITNGGVLTNSSGSVSNFVGVITLGSSSSINTTGNITLGGGITGNFNLTKTGTGILSLGSSTSSLGGITINAGTLNSTSGMLNLTGDFTNNSLFTHNNGAVTFNGAGAQAINSGGSSFNNLAIAGSGTKTFSVATSINNNLSIASGAVANLGSITSHTAGTLTLAGVGEPSGTWGGNGGTSGATFTSPYISATAGYLTVSSGTCVSGTWTGLISTDWNNANNWCDGVVPTPSTNVIINSGGNQPVIGVTAVCNNLTINSGATLTVTGTNTLTVSSNLSNNGTFAPGTGTVILNGAAQTISGTTSTTFKNLSLTGTSSVTTGANITIGGNLNIGDGTTLTSRAYDLTVTGTTTIGGGASGKLTITSTTGTKIFTGAVTINSGGVMSENVAEDLTFKSDVINYGTLTENGSASIGFAGNFVNNGTYNGNTGIHTFSGTGKSISGSIAISIGNAAISGTYTNNGTLTVGTALSGIGVITNTGSLNIGGICSITTFANSGTTAVTGTSNITTALANFTNIGTLNLNGSGIIAGITNNAAGIVNLANSGTITSFNNATATSTLNISDLTVPTISTLTVSTAGNTVNYNGTGNQTVKDISYSNITFSGSGTKTFTVAGTRTTNVLTVAPGVTLLLNGNNSLTPASAVINGAVTVQNTASFVKGSGIISFTSGSFFNDAIDGGVIPTATWDVNSTCNITGYVSQAGGNTSTGPTSFQASLLQSFGNFTWNSINQTNGVYSFYAQLSTVNGNLTIGNTGLGSLTLGNVGTGDLTVGGNFIQTGGNFSLSSTGARSMSVGGNVKINGGIFDLSSSTTTANYTTVNVGGDFSFTGGTITESGTTVGSIINFNGTTGTQTFKSGGTLNSTVNFAILSGASVDFGTSIISSGSTGSFKLYQGGTLITANTAGITTSGATGSIQLQGTRTYNPGANYVYNGTTAQSTGNGLINPASVTISNSAGVTFSTATAMNYLTITNGAKANLGTFGHTASALSLNGDGYSTGTWGGTGSGATNTDPVYFSANSGVLTLTNSAGQAFSTTTTVTIPCGVTSITVEAWGGGGAGSTLTAGTNGAGGGGGAYSKGVVTVIPGYTYQVTIGQGGSNGSAGGDSWFNTVSTILAKGGSGVAQNSNIGATGGQASVGFGTTKFSGGTGAIGTGSGTTGYSGGGGSSAGTIANGSNGVANVNSGGTAPAGGGNGGSGGAFATPSGVAGSTPGGGGGGAYRNGSGSPVGGNGGNGQVIITYINVIPSIVLGSNPTVCQGSTSANLPYSTTTGCPDKYSIVYNSTALAAGFVNVTYAALPSTPIILNVPAGAAAGTYQGNLSLVNSSTGSPSAKYPITVTLNPTASINPITSTTCSSTPFTVTPVNNTDGVVPSGTTYSWSVPVVTGNMTGGASGSAATDISGTLTNLTNTVQTAIYTVTPLSGSCSGNTFTVTVTINPVPALTPITTTACSGGAFTVTPLNTTNGIVPVGTTYSWTGPVVTGGMTGGVSESGASGINGTLINPTNTMQTATYTVTPISGGCSGGSTFTLTVTVYPTPAISDMTISAVSGGAFTITPVNGTNGLVPSGTTYSWSTPLGIGFSGGAASSSTPTDITGTLTLTGSSASATYTVTPTYISCSGNPFTVTVTITPNLWVGSSISKDWALGTNWAAGAPPAYGDDVVFAPTPNNDLVLNDDRIIGNLTNTSNRKLFISPGKMLTINGTINTNNDPDKIHILSSSTLPNGSLIFSTTSPVYGTVEMYSKAFCNSPSTKTDYKWQYFGIPVSSMTASPTFDGSYVRSWDETAIQATHWISLNNSSPLTPFIGYEITQLTARTVVFTGQLVNWDSPVENLSYTPITGSEIRFPGQNIYANPYTAAIDISLLQFGSADKDIIENTVYLYSTGSWNDWTNVGGVPILTGDNPSYGQYTAIPINLAHGGLGLPSQVPSMQAMLIWSHKIDPGATFSIPYSAVIKNTAQQRVQSNKDATLSGNNTGSEIEVTGKNHSDKMWLFTQPGCTHNFDNGWDGAKIIGDALTPQLFSIESDGNYQVNSVDDINNTQLGFQAGQDKEYTLTFTHQNLKTNYSAMYLYDIAENKTVDITESGTIYSFTAVSTPTPQKRFILLTRNIEPDSIGTGTQLKVFNSGNIVFVDNSSSLTGNIAIYDMTGRVIKTVKFEPYGISAIRTDAITGAYIVTAATLNEKVSKKIIIKK